jgi:hypothetical protein
MDTSGASSDNLKGGEGLLNPIDSRRDCLNIAIVE